MVSSKWKDEPIGLATSGSGVTLEPPPNAAGMRSEAPVCAVEFAAIPSTALRVSDPVT